MLHLSRLVGLCTLLCCAAFAAELQPPESTLFYGVIKYESTSHCSGEVVHMQLFQHNVTIANGMKGVCNDNGTISFFDCFLSPITNATTCQPSSEAIIDKCTLPKLYLDRAQRWVCGNFTALQTRVPQSQFLSMVRSRHPLFCLAYILAGRVQ